MVHQEEFDVETEGIPLILEGLNHLRGLSLVEGSPDRLISVLLLQKGLILLLRVSVVPLIGDVPLLKVGVLRLSNVIRLLSALNRLSRSLHRLKLK